MHRALPLLLCCAVLLPAPASAARKRFNQLLRVTEPAGRKVASAHPFVNVVVRFGSGPEGTVDPASFRARLGGVNVTPLFQPTVENGEVTGMRAALGPALLAPGARRANRLRMQVRGRSPKGRPIHDADLLRFRSADMPDQAPVAHARMTTGSDVLISDVPLQFDGASSDDPEGDELSYHWDFGDGTTSEEAGPVHVFRPSAADVTVRLTVSDGQLDGHDQVTMLAVPTVPPGRTPGILKVDAPAPLEFAAVPLGQGATLSFTVSNPDPTPTSDLIVRLGMNGAFFALDPTRLDLGPGESAPVTLTFAPAAAGHQTAEITVVASATNQTSVHFLSHGHGGAAPGTGPLPVAEPVFFNGLTGSSAGIFPDGTRFAADTNVHTCLTPQNGPGFGDYCLTDADCAANNGTCALIGTCIRGDNAGQPCSTPADCPNGFCPSALPFDPVKMCGDGEGGLYMASDSGTYTDPRLDPTDELTGTIMRVQFDGSGNRVGAGIIERTTDGTTQIACDKIPAAAGGQIYIAEDRAYSPAASCFRDMREALVAKKKSTGNEDVLVFRIDTAEGLDPCNDDFDPVDDLEATRNGSAVFAALPAGIFRLRPTFLLMTPDVDDIFAVHPDGSVLVVTSADQGGSGLLRLYKISVDQAINGAPHLSDLAPCATVEVPNNRGASSLRVTTFISFAVDPVAPGSGDATVLLSLLSGGGSDVLSPSLRVRGTVAISSPAGSPTCSVIGLVNLEPIDQLTF
jgi:PKD repeat protein